MGCIVVQRTNLNQSHGRPTFNFQAAKLPELIAIIIRVLNAQNKTALPNWLPSVGVKVIKVDFQIAVGILR
jgi:hypothetical protein